MNSAVALNNSQIIQIAFLAKNLWFKRDIFQESDITLHTIVVVCIKLSSNTSRRQ